MNIIELSKIMVSCPVKTLISQVKCLCISRCKQNGGGGGGAIAVLYSIGDALATRTNSCFIA